MKITVTGHPVYAHYRSLLLSDEVRDLLQDHDVEFVKQGGDVVLSHVNSEQQSLDFGRPTIIWERTDSSTLRYRYGVKLSHVRVYVKGNSRLKDWHNYNAPHQTDRFHYTLYYNTLKHRNGFEKPQIPYPVITQADVDKEALLYSGTLATPMQRAKNLEWPEKRKYDIHFAGTVERVDPIYTRHRQDAINRITQFSNICVSKGKKAWPEYIKDMLNSKIVVAPWGLGEVCYRDAEAIACGCEMIKPDMSHLVSWPDLYQPYITYFPCKPDFSDLKEVVRIVLALWKNREEQREMNRQYLESCWNPEVIAKRFLKILNVGRLL